MYNKYIGDANVEFIVQLFNNNYLVVEKANGELVSGVLSGFNKSTKVIEFKKIKFLIPKNQFNNEFDIKEKRNIFTISDKAFYLYDVDILGNRKLRLTYKIK